MAKYSSRSLWTAKLTGKALPRPTPSVALEPKKAFEGVILGVDPSLRGTGLALIRFSKESKHPILLKSLTVRPDKKDSFARCLGLISKSVNTFLNDYRVDYAALEATIYVQNLQVAQKLGAARGAAIAALALKNIEICEYPPLRIKQAIVGHGRASKEQVANTLKGILNHKDPLPFDEADAAGAALCHAWTFGRN